MERYTDAIGVTSTIVVFITTMMTITFPAITTTKIKL